MLFRVVFSPVILDSIPDQPEFQGYFFNSIEILLSDLDENCILLEDDQKILRRKIREKVNRCPVKYRKRLKALLRQLKKKFVTKEMHELSNCTKLSCKESSMLLFSCRPDAIFVAGDCHNCLKSKVIETEAVDLSQYSASAFSKLRKEKSKINILPGEMKAEEFSRRYIIPIFREAKHIKVYDRVIGDTILENGIGVKTNYKQTLEWLIALFQKFSDNKRAARRFIIYSSFFAESIKSPKKVVSIKKEICNFELSLQKKVNFPVKVIFKCDTKSKKLPHARYLFTEHIGFLIERGADLLIGSPNSQVNWSHPELDQRDIRDVGISLVSKDNKKKIERYAQSLDDL